ncbi:MAG: glutathione peroxidase [Erysipelotrichaceae bacterium]|nr:glutathione peroxidase [Erysipelotrichaceae bacterium]
MSIYNFSVKDKDNNDVSLSKYKGKVVLIVNSATRCGYTKQYPALEELYQKYKDDGFIILDFPSNQFGGQAPEDIEDYVNICMLDYGVTYPIFNKIKVNGKDADPLYDYLKSTPAGEGKRIRWNFTKFLINREGEVVARFDSKITPAEIDPEVAKLI